MNLNKNIKEICIREGGKYKPGAKYYLDTPILISVENGKTSAKWSNYRVWASLYILIWVFSYYLVLSLIVTGIIPSLIFHLMNIRSVDWVKKYFDYGYVLLLMFAFILSIFPFSKTWPTIFSQLKANPRRVEINQDEIIFYEKDKRYIFPKAQTKVIYEIENLFEKMPIKVAKFYFQSNGMKVPFYRAVMRISPLVKNKDYRDETCDEFVRNVETNFGLTGSQPPSN